MNEIRRNVPVDEQIEILKRGVVDLVTEDDLRHKLEQSLETGKPLRVKLGADPTRPDLHLGHAVILRKMRQFQDLGHQVIMLIGDFTAMIGDPSGKSKTRPPLTLEETRANAQSYLEQCRLILRGEPDVLEIRYNGEWLEPMGYADVIRLASKYTVARILERDDFTKRLQAQTPISLHELLYPVTQGYDSVALEADVELGGTDQLFNNLVGRALQRDYGQEAQVVMTLPLLVGLDGTEKMSKSLDNYIGLTDEPHIMFAKLMKVPDALLENYFTLLTDLSEEQIDRILRDKISAHKVLANLVTTYVHHGLIPNRDSLEATEPLLARKTLGYDLSFEDENNIIFNSQRLVDLVGMLRKASITLDKVIDIYDDMVGDIDENILKDLSVSEKLVREGESKIEYISKIINLEDSDYINDEIEKSITYLSSYGILGNITDHSKKLMIEVIENEISPFDDAQIINSVHDIFYSKSRYQHVAKGGIPDNIPEFNITAELDNSIDADRISMAKLVVLAGLEPSNGAARKLIQNRGLKLNGEIYTDPQGQLTRAELAAEGGAVIQKGKDKFARFVLES